MAPPSPREFKAASRSLPWWLAWAVWDAIGVVYALKNGVPASVSAVLETAAAPLVGVWITGSAVLLALAIRSTIVQSARG
jgi:hypothetical protein